MTSQTSPSPRSTAIPFRNRWKGQWMLAVAVLHTLYAAVVFPTQLQEIVRRDLPLQVVVAVAARRDHHRAEREIDPGAQPEGGDDRAQLACLREGLDDPRALRIAQAAVVAGDPRAEQPRIAVAPVPDQGVGIAINDRLRRAAA